MAEQWENLQVDGSTMRAFLCTPGGAGPHPAVVVIQHAGGVDKFIEEMTRRIAAAGYVGIAPDLYHREDPNSTDGAMTKMQRLRDDTVIQDVNTALEHLRNTGLATDNIGITGFCMGGRVSFLMAGANPIFKASVPFYGGGTMVSWGDGPSPFDRMANIKCPVLGFFGEDDPNPSPDDMRKIDAELTRHGVPHELHSYAGAGHAYMDFTNAERYREQAEKASWPLTLAFLEKHLGKVSVVAD